MKSGKPGVLRTVIKWVFRVILAVVCAFALLLGYLTLTEYRPEEELSVDVEGNGVKPLAEGETITVMTWNTGYGALGDNADFFMDGGTHVKTADQDRVLSNVEGILDQTLEYTPDLIFYQETDKNSGRSYHIDETELLSDGFPGYASAFATNYKVAFVPYPVPPIGSVHSGLLTLSAYEIESASRIQLPCPFSWPVRLGNLKRCLLISRIPVENGKELVAINLHLEAYDSGEGKIAQTKMLKEVLEAERAKGNYVIAGGDFNQIFSDVDMSMYPVYPGCWEPGVIETGEFGSEWSLVMDNSSPSCRSLDRPYEGEDPSSFQFYLIDGFIVSDNVSVESLETQDLGFVVSDHNPVLMKVILN
ncbi:MAG: hypothetical protein IJ225_08135 [Solobacterium sp.]|nr:hypothetical protein [Solobacterium sp.]